MIEDVECFTEKLQAQLLTDGEFSHYPYVHIVKRRSDIHVASDLRRSASGAATGIRDFAACNSVIDTAAREPADLREQWLAGRQRRHA